jgi:uncharacterized protein YecE (DUF72 family)
MDYGQLSRDRPFDASLAPTHPGSVKLLEKEFLLAACDLPIYVGAPQWTIPGYCKTLPVYAHAWNSVELNTAFYRVPTAEGARTWANETPDDFRFFVKAHQGLSHEFMLWNDHRAMVERMHAFTEGWKGLGEKWGGTFLQLPPGLGFERLALLEQWFAQFDRCFVSGRPPLFVEFREASWFEGRQLRKEAARALAIARVGVVCTDTPGRRDASHGTLTTPELFVRFLGQSLETDEAIFPIDLERLEAWIGRIQELRIHGLQRLNFFIHTPDQHWTPELTRIFTGWLREGGFTTRDWPEKPDPASQLSLF